MKKILFDIDGTLIDDSKNIIKCFKETLKKYGIENWTGSEVREIIGVSIKNVFLNISPLGEEMRKDYRTLYSSLKIGKPVIFEGIGEILDFLEAHEIKRGVVTSRSQDMAEKVVNSLDLKLDCVVGSAEGLNPKPAPDQLLKACRILNVSEKEVLYIGDTSVDAQSAENAGIPFIGVTWGIDGNRIGCKTVVSTPEELLSEIKKFLGIKKLVNQGAEAKLYEDSWLGRHCMVKERFAKGYRIKELDESLRAHRTRGESKLMHEAKEAGVQTPKIYDITENEIVMEFLDGGRVKEILENEDEAKKREACLEIGRNIGKLHKNGIIHGDLTTSNMIVKNDKLYFFDFGLGEKSSEIEKKGVDLHVLLEALTSTGFEDLFKQIMEGYEETYANAKLVEERIHEITKRGRYAR
jgi:TP53 regulating kinase-like protein